jgi:hypothetical protein
VVELASTPQEGERLASAALAAVRRRSWQRALEQLAAGYTRALARARDAGGRRAA